MIFLIFNCWGILIKICWIFLKLWLIIRIKFSNCCRPSPNTLYIVSISKSLCTCLLIITHSIFNDTFIKHSIFVWLREWGNIFISKLFNEFQLFNLCLQQVLFEFKFLNIKFFASKLFTDLLNTSSIKVVCLSGSRLDWNN